MKDYFLQESYYRWMGHSNLESRLDAHYYNPRFDSIKELIKDRIGDVTTLGNICDNLIHQKSAIRKYESSDEFISIPLASTSSFGGGQVLDIKNIITYDELNQKKYPLIDTEGVLACRIPSSKYHFSFYSPTIHGSPVALSPFVIFIRPNREIDPAFLANELSQRYVILQIEKLSQGSLFSTILLTDLLSIKLVIPPLSDREQVAQAVRLRSTLFASDSYGIETISVGKLGSTFEKVLASFEARILDEDWVDPQFCYFIEWNSKNKFETSGRAWAWQVGKRQLKGENLTISPNLRDWLLFDKSDFKIFNSIYRGGVVDLEMVRRLDLCGDLSIHQLTPLIAFLESIKENDKHIDNQELLQKNLINQRSINIIFPELESALTAFGRGIRPILAIGVERYGKPYGAYLLGGPDQVKDPFGVYERLRTAGLSLITFLKSQLSLLPEFAKLGAKRTVSELMHRMNNPLGEIDTALHFLRKWANQCNLMDQLVPDDKEATADAEDQKLPLDEFTLRGYLERIGKAKSNLTNLSRKVRMLAKAEAGGKPDWQEVSIIIDLVLERTQTQRQRVRCEVLRDINSELNLFVWADQELLVEALVNVIENALREMKNRPPRLQIFINFNEETCILEIVDNGIDENAELITDPFEWGTSGYSTSGVGSGFGLAMVRQTFEAFRGNCDLEKLVGEPGCKFWGRLPAKRRSN